MTEFEQLISKEDRKLLDLRRMNRFLHSSAFSDTYVKASEQQKAKIIEALKSNNFHELKRLCATILEREYYVMGIRELRRVGKEFSVPYYSQLTKHELYSKIMTAIKDQDHEVQFAIHQELIGSNGFQSSGQELEESHRAC